MSLAKEIEKLKYDKRLTDYQIRSGKMSKDELGKHLQSLPDSAENVDNLRLSEDGTETQADHLNGNHQ
jgi:hypothetical protein